MLSKKMAVSLTSLIIILALAFVAPSAMAAFSVELDKTGDVSTETANLELVYPGADGKLKLKFEFGKKVLIPKDAAQFVNFDKDGKVLFLQKLPDKAGTDPIDELTLEPTVKDGATTVRVLIAAGIAAANPFDTDTSAKLDETIHLIGADDGPPTVLSIERAVDDDHAFAKISPDTDPTIQVRVTLSELPKAFTTAHINATEATVTSVRQLLTRQGRTLAEFLASDDDLLTTNADLKKLPRVRNLHDEEILPGVQDADDPLDVYTTGGADTASTLQPLQPGDNVATREAKEKAREDYGGIHRAINESSDLGDKTYQYDMLSVRAASSTSVPYTVTAKVDLDGLSTTGDSNAPAKPSAKLTAAKNVSSVPATSDGQNATNIAVEPAVSLAKDTDISGAPTAPVLQDFPNADLYGDAVERYAVLLNEYVTYTNALNKYNAYTDAVAEEQMNDADTRAEKFAEIENPPHIPSLATGAEVTDKQVYPYLVTLTPKYATTKDVVVKVNEFEDRTLPISQKYTPPSLESEYTEDIDKLTIKVAKAKEKEKSILTAGFPVKIAKDIRIPGSGFVVFATNNAGSGVKDNPGNDKDEPKNTERTPAELKYNLVELSGLPNLEAFLVNGGTIDLVGPAGVYISEIMWGSDASLDPNNNSQWIEIANSGTASILTTENQYELRFYGLNETLPAVSTVADRVGTVGAGGYWAPVGQGGRTGTGEQAADVVAVAPTQDLISMQRSIGADGTPADGTLSSSWVASVGPGVNFDLTAIGTRIGSPGAAIDAAKYPKTPTPTTPTPTVPVAAAGEITISEIMVNTDNGRLPQWIELTYSGAAKASLEGWQMVINNAIDAEVVGGGRAITVSLSGVTVDVSKATGNMGDGQSVLIVAWATARHSANIQTARVIDAGTQLGQTSRYQLLSAKGFKITLLPPGQPAIASLGDVVGNLNRDWDLPMSEGSARSSIIRYDTLADGTKTLGTDAKGWVLASSTNLVIGPASYYGDDEDSSTPGHHKGGPLPVELSHFRPARDKTTGAVVITWATQSELNNAGFFIKRSNQRDGEFKVINAAMIVGAGTTSEKQFYTYTDTTAQPNVVYYYQIEDVSLDGNRQTLTRGTRLKGHIGAAGKATVIWGELKSSNE